ncbi:MAG: hypothetical protein HYY06_18990 [Deltaproteobacteria bacterium]|nr:hypothetical protein [Deltaproteobacteria bacterium]
MKRIVLVLVLLGACRPRPIFDGADNPGWRVPSGYRKVVGAGWAIAVPGPWKTVRPRRPSSWVAQNAEPEGGVHSNVRLEAVRYAGDGRIFSKLRLEELRRSALVLGSRDTAMGALQARDVEAIWSRDSPPYHAVQRTFATAGLGITLTCGGADAHFLRTRRTCALIFGSFRLMPDVF